MIEGEGVRIIRPVDPSIEITADYGAVNKALWADFHHGVDFATPKGTSIIAVSDGIAGYDWHNILGAFCWIEDEGKRYRYCHLSRIDLRREEMVTKGQVIGQTGDTGRVTGAHLHFSVVTWPSFNHLRPIFIT